MKSDTEKKKHFDDENGCVKQGLENRVWKFVHQQDYHHQTEILTGRKCDFNWLQISIDGTITAKGSHKKGYAWDGCTPKWNFLQITWGLFDGQLIRHSKGDYKPYTYYASMIHDLLYQYKRCAPVTRKEADLIFLEMLKNAGFNWARIYFIGVRIFGWIFKGWKYQKTSEIPKEIKGSE